MNKLSNFGFFKIDFWLCKSMGLPNEYLSLYFDGTTNEQGKPEPNQVIMSIQQSKDYDPDNTCKQEQQTTW